MSPLPILATASLEAGASAPQCLRRLAEASHESSPHVRGISEARSYGNLIKRRMT
jgi:hypothetical protein